MHVNHDLSNPLSSIFSLEALQMQALMCSSVSSNFKAMLLAFSLLYSSSDMSPTFFINYSHIKPTTAAPFLFPSCSSLEKFYFSPFYIWSYHLASLKPWYFVFCMFSKLLPTLMFSCSVWFLGTVARMITQIHSNLPYILNYMTMDWLRRADYIQK